jgi:hypothetical protein
MPLIRTYIFPLVVGYFLELQEVKVKLLDLKSVPAEKMEILSSNLVPVIKKSM